jgi:hypothetical protein
VNEVQHQVIVGPTVSGLHGERFRAHRLADRGDPLLPFVGVLWFGVGVEQQVAAERASAALTRDQSPSVPVERRGAATSTPGGPVAGERRVIG